MKKMDYANAIIDTYNLVVGAIVAVFFFIMGGNWGLFFVFFGLNIAGWSTGWVKNRVSGKEKFVKGRQGGL